MEKAWLILKHRHKGEEFGEDEHEVGSREKRTNDQKSLSKLLKELLFAH